MLPHRGPALQRLQRNLGMRLEFLAQRFDPEFYLDTVTPCDGGRREASDDGLGDTGYEPDHIAFPCSCSCFLGFADI